MSIYTETTRTQALAGHEQARRIYAIRARNWSTASTWADRPEHPNTRVTRRAVDAASIGTFRPSSARAQFARGTDVLFGEQVDQHAALRVDLMRRGVAAPIGPRFSRAAAQHDRRARRFGSAFVREWNAGDVAAAFHAFDLETEHGQTFSDLLRGPGEVDVLPQPIERCLHGGRVRG